ncbi:hypothetical protein F7P69_00855 [Cellulosimicrobium funkei]|nr:hypothetical protein [Cellulosimicrobium funkei]
MTRKRDDRLSADRRPVRARAKTWRRGADERAGVKLEVGGAYAWLSPAYAVALADRLVDLAEAAGRDDAA